MTKDERLALDKKFREELKTPTLESLKPRKILRAILIKIQNSTKKDDKSNCFWKSSELGTYKKPKET